MTNEPLTLKVTYNGEPLTDFPVSLKRDGAQYTSNSTPNKSMTDKEGEIHFSFEQGGRYILSVNHSVTENAPLYDEVTYRLYYAFEVNFE